MSAPALLFEELHCNASRVRSAIPAQAECRQHVPEMALDSAISAPQTAQPALSRSQTASLQTPP